MSKVIFCESTPKEELLLLYSLASESRASALTKLGPLQLRLQETGEVVSLCWPKKLPIDDYDVKSLASNQHPSLGAPSSFKLVGSDGVDCGLLNQIEARLLEQTISTTFDVVRL